MMDPDRPKRPKNEPLVRYSKPLADEIVDLIRNGWTLIAVARKIKIPRSTISTWFKMHPEFGEAYQDALVERTHYWADEVIDIADDATNDFIERQGRNGPYQAPNVELVMRSQLRIRTRLQLMGFMNHTYSNKARENEQKAEPQPIHINIDTKDYGFPPTPGTDGA